MFAFRTGEVWSIDTSWLRGYVDDKRRGCVPASEDDSFRVALQSYSRFLQSLGIDSSLSLDRRHGRFEGSSALHSGPSRSDEIATRAERAVRN